MERSLGGNIKIEVNVDLYHDELNKTILTICDPYLISLSVSLVEFQTHEHPLLYSKFCLGNARRLCPHFCPCRQQILYCPPNVEITSTYSIHVSRQSCLYHYFVAYEIFKCVGISIGCLEARIIGVSEAEVVGFVKSPVAAGSVRQHLVIKEIQESICRRVVQRRLLLLPPPRNGRYRADSHPLEGRHMDPVCSALS